MAGRVPLDASVIATDRQLSTTLSGEVIILGLDDSMYYGLTATGARIWELVQVRRTVEEILAAVTDEFEVDRARAEADLEALLGDLQARGLVAITRSATDR
jgi:hypothetical protein